VDQSGTFTPGRSTNITVTFITLGHGEHDEFRHGQRRHGHQFIERHCARHARRAERQQDFVKPTNTPVAIGSNVVFRITIQNTGDTVIPRCRSRTISAARIINSSPPPSRRTAPARAV